MCSRFEGIGACGEEEKKESYRAARVEFSRGLSEVHDAKANGEMIHRGMQPLMPQFEEDSYSKSE